jgi:hypothetical protein
MKESKGLGFTSRAAQGRTKRKKGLGSKAAQGSIEKWRGLRV